MMQKPINNTDSTYHKELSIQVRLSGLSFCVYNPILDLYESTETFTWDAQKPLSVIEHQIRDYFSRASFLKQSFSKVRVMHTNEWFTLVPKVFFDPQQALDMLKYNVKILASDEPSFDAVEVLQLNVIYLPYTRVNNLLLDYFPNFDYEHCASVFLKTTFSHQGQHLQKSVYVNLEKDLFLMAVFDKDKLLIYNQFHYHSEDDFLYYLLFSLQELSVDMNEVPLYIMGMTVQQSPLLERIKRYAARVILFEQLHYAQQVPHTHFLLTQMF